MMALVSATPAPAAPDERAILEQSQVRIYIKIIFVIKKSFVSILIRIFFTISRQLQIYYFYLNTFIVIIYNTTNYIC